ncbi:LysR substrate-binding domain-containing protein [Micromonospora peucetia]|uniref:DNA-binding transcriptional regulator, LysR family n=1 Tax=Micromonospora peucetia TaxID=47871 RepID=A0A1C6VXW8_9ACTN|nr:LysR substrate-binding domain-containing protein [Micromonospora peucetia]MCX4390595.1 LysR substrate-binding domain-containing protein [Micromonospora peucetia]WSA31533.1 LysR substrate-binding domain-containing protein [Micromonospora peucetia]SCL71191.1 DNA-binding transcriptional regulator, LysR family [Micromonospora peucetia]
MQPLALDVFRTVARHGSITAAARELRYTQSAVSRQIAALEADLGVALFDRLPRGVALTEPGRCLLPHAEAVLDRLTTAHRDLDALRGLGGGRLRVGAFPTAMAALVPRALAAFRAAYPRVALSVVEGRTPDLLERLLAGDADVAVVSAPADRPLDTGRFDLRHLLDERLLVAVARDHRLARRRTVRLAELADDPFIAGSAGGEDPLMRATMPPGFRPRTDIVAADWTGKLGCVAAGLGVALVPALAVRAAPADLVLLRLHADDAPARRVYAATVGGRHRPPAVDRLVAGLAEEAAGAASPARRVAGRRPISSTG